MELLNPCFTFLKGCPKEQINSPKICYKHMFGELPFVVGFVSPSKQTTSKERGALYDLVEQTPSWNWAVFFGCVMELATPATEPDNYYRDLKSKAVVPSFFAPFNILMWCFCSLEWHFCGRCEGGGGAVSFSCSLPHSHWRRCAIGIQRTVTLLLPTPCFVFSLVIKPAQIVGFLVGQFGCNQIAQTAGLD